MNEDTKTCLTIIVAIAIVMAAALGGCHEVYSIELEREAIKAGLVQKQGVGTTMPYWTKP
jgi:hypothetical protein